MRKITATMLHAIGPLVSEGHYLNRLILLCELFELHPYARLLDAARLFANVSCKAPGVDLVIYDASAAIIQLAESEHGLKGEALRPIAWALDFNALQAAKLDYLRLDYEPQPDPSRHPNTRRAKTLAGVTSLIGHLRAVAEERTEPTQEEIAARIRAKNGGPK